MNYFKFTYFTPLFGHIVTILALDHSLTPCTPVGFCKCGFPNGYGVDLSSINWNISFNSFPGREQDVVYYFPCKNYNIGNETSGTCGNGTTLCIISDNKSCQNLGRINEGRFEWQNLALSPTIVYAHKNVITRIELTCSSSPDAVLSYVSSSDSTYSLKLESSHLCASVKEHPGQRSFFSLLCILFLMFFLLYFVGGFLVLKFIRGATGWEAVPNSEFWKSAYGSFKKSITYCVNGCQHPQTYDTI